MDPRYQQLAERIRTAEFHSIRFSPGYNEREVDDFLDRIVGLLREGARPNPDELRTVQFSPSRLRPGYVQQDVDRLLQEIEEAVRAL
jgi:DivIVA domain-containing protein